MPRTMTKQGGTDDDFTVEYAVDAGNGNSGSGTPCPLSAGSPPANIPVTPPPSYILPSDAATLGSGTTPNNLEFVSLPTNVSATLTDEAP